MISLKYARDMPLMAILALVLISGTTSAFFTDYDEKSNQLKVGYEETRITEEFPPSDPVPVTEDPEFKKTVQIQKPASGNNSNTDCFVRARVLFSNSDIGNAVTLNGTDESAWILAEDGYYYYTRILHEGEATTPVFTSLSIDSSRIPEWAADYFEDFRCTVYEESIAAGIYVSWKEAWQHSMSKDAI